MASSFVFQSDIESLIAKSAIVLYGDPHSRSVLYALHHRIELDSSGSPALMEGHPIKIDALDEALQSLMKLNGNVSGFLPEGVLLHSANAIAWWCKPGRRHFFVKNKDGKVMTVDVKHPGIVFRASHKGLRIATVTGSERPLAESACYCAPFFNIYEDGWMCKGNVDYPDGKAVSSIAAWESAFFDSVFTHPNSQRIVNYPSGLNGLWSDLMRGTLTEIPESCLVPMLDEHGQSMSVEQFCLA